MAGAKRHERAAATRAHLLAAARTVFAERGYQAASVAAITEAAETAHGTFYLYFRNREDAFVQVMSDALEGLYQHAFTPLDEIGAGFDPQRNRERIAAFVNGFVAHGRLWRALLEAVLVSPVVEAQWSEIRNRFQAGVAERMAIYRGAGQLGDLEPAAIAYALSSMLEWVAFTGVAFDSPRPLEVDDPMIDVVAEVWNRVLSQGRPPEVAGG